MRIEKPSISDLHGDTATEHRFGALAYELMQGRDVDGEWLQIVKMNTPKNAHDAAVYEVDFGLTADCIVVGYIDLECKPQWRDGAWPYRVTNIARYPMAHWEENRFNGRHTNKIMRFAEKPDLSFWIAMRTDWQACWIIRAIDIFKHGVEGEQGTRYSERALPVYHIDNTLGHLCEQAQDLTEYITTIYHEVQHAAD